MKEFFGFGGYTRKPEGYMSAEHLIFVSSVMAVMIAAGIIIGLLYRRRSDSEKNRVMIVSAILIDAVEILKIVIICIRSSDPLGWLYMLPLFLCSIFLIAMPLAAFSRGRMKEASLDFIFIFGLLIAFLGTYGAGNNYASYPVFSIDNVASAVTHAISGFASLYVAVSGMLSMKRRNIHITFLILTGFCAAAYIANRILDYNYMFLMRGDGTPYDVVYGWVNGNPVLYPLAVYALFLIYIALFYAVFYLIRKKKKTADN